jgi:hypothetical protein
VVGEDAAELRGNLVAAAHLTPIETDDQAVGRNSGGHRARSSSMGAVHSNAPSRSVIKPSTETLIE